MIPHRVLRNEISGIGLRERVTACRKRLRGSRGAQRTHDLNEVCELFAETEGPRISERDDFENGTILSLAQEQEVGIT